jgi:hypothetical protein
MVGWTRVLRPSRPELLALAALVGIGLVLLLALAARLAAFGIPASCFASSDAPSAACQKANPGDIASYLDIAGVGAPAAFLAIAAGAPLVGVILGLTLIAKDIELGTTEFAWSMSPSRRRWMVMRLAPVAIAIVAVGGATGLVAELLEALRQPTIDAQLSFDDLGARGPIVPALTVFALGISLLVGSVVGRVLMSLLLAAAVVGLAMFGMTLLDENVLKSESVVVVVSDDLGPGSRIEYLIRTPNGEIISYQEAYKRYGSAAVDQLDPSLGLTQMVRWVPGQLYPLANWRLAIAYSVLGLASATLALAVVDRRRP